MPVTDATESLEARGADESANFIRAAGWAGLAAVLILVVSDFAIYQAWNWPEPTATADEINDWVTDNTGRLRAGNGIVLAYLPLFGMFFAGVITMLRSRALAGWLLVGLIGSVVMLSTAVVGSAVSAVLFWRADHLIDEPQVSAALWGINHAIFLALAVGYVLCFVGFGVAGRLSGQIPLWVAVVGYVGAILGTTSVLFIAETLDLGWSEFSEFLSFVLAMIWWTSMSIVLIRHPSES